MDAPQTADVMISGAGPVGLSLAIWTCHGFVPLQVFV